MTFNLKKAQKAGDTVSPQSVSLLTNAKKYNLSLDGTNVEGIQKMLETDRRDLGESPKTYEGLLSEARTNSKTGEKISEGEMNDSKSELFPHRRYKEGEDEGITVSPIDALSTAHDRKFRDAFSKANKGADTEFWDKFVGEQLDGEKTTVGRNLPEKGSQLAASPHRFGNLDGVPHDPDAIKNRENFGKELDIEAISKSKDKPLEITSSLHTADKLLFGIYLKANSEKRELTAEEKEIVAAVNKDKVAMLMALAQMPPPSPTPAPAPIPQSGQGFDPHNPDHADEVAGDEVLWGQLSGVDQPNEAEPLPHQDSGEVVHNDNDLDFPGFPSPQSSSDATAISYTGGVGKTEPQISPAAPPPAEVTPPGVTNEPETPF
jgi:hypothetical protein